MCMWFGFNPAINFYHFSSMLTVILQFFAGVTSASLKFDLYYFFTIYDIDKIVLGTIKV